MIFLETDRQATQQQRQFIQPLRRDSRTKCREPGGRAAPPCSDMEKPRRSRERRGQLTCAEIGCQADTKNAIQSSASSHPPFTAWGA